MTESSVSDNEVVAKFQLLACVKNNVDKMEITKG